jgi:hypothetical protein
MSKEEKLLMFWFSRCLFVLDWILQRIFFKIDWLEYENFLEDVLLGIIVGRF